MKINFCFLLIMAGIVSAQAQSIKIPTGKKFTVTAEVKLKTTTSVMGNDMDIDNTNTIYTDYEVKEVKADGYTLTATPKRIKVSMSMTGMDQSFDSDDASIKDNPQAAGMFAALNKPTDIEVNANGVNMKGDLADKINQMGLPANGGSDLSKMIILQKDLAKLVEGKQWTDSSVSESNHSVSEYLVMTVDAATALVQVKTTTQLKMTINQAGMEIKQSIHGTSTAKRTYNKLSGQLMKEESSQEMEGTMEVMGQTAPLSIKGNTITTVN